MRVRARSDDGGYLVQIPSRGGSEYIFARSLFPGGHTTEDEVVVLHPEGGTPIILALSPFACNTASVSPHDHNAADFDGFDERVSDNSDVIANLAAAHDRGHTLLSTPDHPDAPTDIPATGAVIRWNGTEYVPVAAPTYIDETPAGAVNGSNVTFTLSETPYTLVVLELYVNGLLQKLTTHFSLSGTTITFVDAPATGDILTAAYYF